MANKTKSSNIVVGLDIGTSKVVCIVGKFVENRLEIIALGAYPSSGLKKGVVVNIDATTDAISKAVEQAQSMIEEKIKSVFVGIAGNHIKSLNSQGAVGIKDKEVTSFDIDRVIDSAQAVSIPSDQRVLHVLPQEFVIDGQEVSLDPLGMSGVRLEAKVHLVTCSNSAIKNIEKCIKNCGLGVQGFVLEQLASSHSILSNDEKDLGVCLVDIGGGTTDIAIFVDGAIRHTAVIPVAGDQVTNDIAMALRTPTQYAEDLKVRYACALTQLAGVDEFIKVPGVGDKPDRELSRQTLAEVVEPRYDELFKLVLSELRRSGFEQVVASGIVLTGGGAKMEGLVELAEEIFHMPVTLGSPREISGLKDIVRNPVFATGVGLLQYGLDRERDLLGKQGDRESGLFARAKLWLKENF